MTSSNPREQKKIAATLSGSGKSSGNSQVVALGPSARFVNRNAQVNDIGVKLGPFFHNSSVNLDAPRR
jgi:hypothetical protein